jgi:hypothetical protein
MMKGISLLIILTAISIGACRSILKIHRRIQRIKSERSGITLDDFRQEFRDAQYNENAVEAAFHDFVDSFGFPVRREDELWETLNLYPEDVDRMVERRALQLGVADIWHSPYSGSLPLDTVEDYVRLLSQIMMTQEEGRGPE